MKKFQIAFVVAVLISGLFFSQVSAASSSSASAAAYCGKTYTVVGGDTLTKIASKCGTTLADILYWNPQITNANLIYIGQVLNMAGTSSVPTPAPSGGTTVYVGNAYITISATTVNAGDSVVVKAFNFPKNASIDFRLYKKGTSEWKAVYDGTTDGTGYARKSVAIPSGSANGSTWIIKVMTTDRTPVLSIASPVITVGSAGSGSNNSDDASVTLSKTSVAAGGTIKATVEGFPKNQDIDYCIKEKGAKNSTCVWYDGKTDGSGDASQTLTVPDTAESGDKWVVMVKTTNLSSVVMVTSSSFTIK